VQFRGSHLPDTFALVGGGERVEASHHTTSRRASAAAAAAAAAAMVAVRFSPAFTTPGKTVV